MTIAALAGGNPCQTTVLVGKYLHVDIGIIIERLKHTRKSVLQGMRGHDGSFHFVLEWRLSPLDRIIYYCREVHTYPFNRREVHYPIRRHLGLSFNFREPINHVPDVFRRNLAAKREVNDALRNWGVKSHRDSVNQSAVGRRALSRFINRMRNVFKLGSPPN